jgi:hypothetical protein
MIDSEEILLRVCGAPDIAAFKRVKATQMRFAHAARQLIARDLGGMIPESGKQFLDTPLGRWRLASKPNSDNSTEAYAHRQMGARPVLMFGDLSAFRRKQGWISIEELYEAHDVPLDPRRLVRLAAKLAGHPEEATESVKHGPRAVPRPVVRSSRTAASPKLASTIGT